MNSTLTETAAETTTAILWAEGAGPRTRATESLALAGLRNRLVQEELNRASAEPLKRLVRLAAAEAEAQAWLTSFPLLLFPSLLEEKVSEAHRYVARQRRVRPSP